MRSLLFSSKISMRTFIVFFSFLHFLSFFLQKRYLSFSQESLLFYTFLKAIREKMFFPYRKKQEKNIIFVNVLIVPILSSIIEYLKHLKTLTSVFVKSHTSIDWNVTPKLLELQGTPSVRQALLPKKVTGMGFIVQTSSLTFTQILLNTDMWNDKYIT